MFLIFKLALIAAIAHSQDDSSQSNIQSCVEFQLADNYGAGWGTATLQVKTDHGDQVTYESYAPDSSHNPLSVKYCNGANNLQISTSRRRLFSEEVATAKSLTVSIQGKSDGYTGALLWKAIDLQTNEVLLGNYLTSMELELNVQDNSAFIVLSNAQNVVNLNNAAQVSCSSCTASTSTSSSSNEEGTFYGSNIVSTASVYSMTLLETAEVSYLTGETSVTATPETETVEDTETKEDAETSNAGEVAGGSEDEKGEAVDEDTEAEEEDGDDPDARVRRKLLTNIYLDGNDGTWFSADGYGTTYEILDSTGTTQFYAGQLCSSSAENACQINLAAGTYLWRVNGALDSNRDSIAWQYCGAQGGAATELEFSIDSSGNCIPESWKSASVSSVLTDSSTSDYVLQGSFLLTRTDDSDFTDSALDLLKSALALESVGTQQSMVTLNNGVQIVSYEEAESITSSGQSSSGDSASSTGDTKQFVFNLEFTSSEFNSLRSSSSSDSVNEVISTLRQNLRNSMESGTFVSDVVQKATYEGEECLETVTTAELLKLQLYSQAYDTEELVVVDEGFSIIADGVVLSGCVLGVVLGIWIRQYMKRRSEQREFEIDLSRSSVSVSTSLPRSLNGPDMIHHSMRPSAVPDVEQIQ
mmetsp:Transcript_19681/g.19777  ORF Transcript_19681/g.19777 Transcript_19681/m.19777 type:complete len:642 (-) Transcript_19681:224-2149(-)